jgi:hypothetical protein
MKKLPKCNESFCEHCGDCEVCYGDFECFINGYHYFIDQEESGTADENTDTV